MIDQTHRTDVKVAEIDTSRGLTSDENKVRVKHKQSHDLKITPGLKR